MRNLILDYSFTGGTRQIKLPKIADLQIENIRLIVNETQKVVICSSMQKDNIISIEHPEGEGSIITYTDSLPQLNITQGVPDKLTIEVDMGTDVIYSGGVDWYINFKCKGTSQQPYTLTKELVRPFVNAMENGVGNNCELSYLFAKTSIEFVDFSELTNPQIPFNGMFTESKVYNVDFSNLKNVINLSQIFSITSSIEVINFPELATGSLGNQVFWNCPDLKKILLPKFNGYVGSQVFESNPNLIEIDVSSFDKTTNIYQNNFRQIPKLETLHCHPLALSKNARYYNIFITWSMDNSSAVNFKNLFISIDAYDNIYLGTASCGKNLSFKSIQNILSHLSMDVSNFVCQFVQGTTIMDDIDGTLTTLYNEKSQNWDIQGLTINPYSE